MSLTDIYTELIAEHSRSTENKHELAGATVKERGHNPSCGDEITLELIVEAGKIKDAAFTGVGCAISQASTSMMIDLVKGKTVEEAHHLADLFICYAYECDAGLRYLSPEEAEAMGYANPDLLRTRAVKNLRKRKNQSKFYGLEGGAYSIVLDGVYDVSLLLILNEILPPSWLHSAVIAAPSRGELLLVKDDSPANLQELQTLVEEVSRKTANPVSPHLYRWQDGQLRLYRTNN